MSCSAIKNGWKFARAAVAQELAEHQWAGDEQLGFFTSHVFLGFAWVWVVWFGFVWGFFPPLTY